MHQLWRPLTTRAIAMPFRVELCRDRRYGQPFTLARFPAKLPHVLDQMLLYRKMTIRLHTFDAFTASALSVLARRAASTRSLARAPRTGRIHQPTVFAIAHEVTLAAEGQTIHLSTSNAKALLDGGSVQRRCYRRSEST